ncbi:hypothetical protein MTO96_013746 [Rhipicephalus appendiculatus]
MTTLVHERQTTKSTRAIFSKWRAPYFVIVRYMNKYFRKEVDRMNAGPGPWLAFPSAALPALTVTPRSSFCRQGARRSGFPGATHPPPRCPRSGAGLMRLLTLFAWFASAADGYSLGRRGYQSALPCAVFYRAGPYEDGSLSR